MQKLKNTARFYFEKYDGNWRTRWAERWRERVWVWREPAAEARRSLCSSLCLLSTTTRRSFRECDQTQLGSRSPNPHLYVIQPNTFTNSNILLRSAKILRLYSGLPGRTFPSFFFKSFGRFLFSLSAVNLCLAGAAGATGIWGVGCNLYTNFSGAIITRQWWGRALLLLAWYCRIVQASLAFGRCCLLRAQRKPIHLSFITKL